MVTEWLRARASVSAWTMTRCLRKRGWQRTVRNFAHCTTAATSARMPRPARPILALCGILAFWTGGDAEQIDRLFRRSTLFRQEKWDAEHFADGKSYGQGTIAKAIAGTREFYQPNNRHIKKGMAPCAQPTDGQDGIRRSAITLSAIGRYLAPPGKWPPGITGA